ncbi:MAG: TolC family protein [candidate division KSB1 bacterium]|nr:TolC family protein [candidate division KSB1 bacterium]MDZ7272716.1 TolC family protein [candidate division KSB1 bacterium]MDZ7284258.1 TolC family protein [candidate division KSB1 bacterium]MDZ7297343.1 TolC family protein [candidate division KSB1 bacterium]MDZ7307052.1 TolC family protein [candidate division KSB1 bacterium]
MKSIVFSFVCALLLCWGGKTAALAQSEHGETVSLAALLREARARNPEIRAAQKRWQAMQARIKPAVTLEDPQIGLQVMYVPYPLRNAFKNERALTISQMFEFPGKLGLMSGMAKREAQASGAEYERVVLRVLTEVKKIYFMLFHLDYELANNRENRALMRQFIEIASVKYATGMGLQPDILKAQTEYSMMFNDSLMLAQERRSMAAMLNALLDRPRDSHVPVIHEHFDPRHHSFNLDSLVQTAFAHRPELKNMQAMADMYQLSARLARREYFPNFMLSYTHRKMPEMKTWDAMVSFNVPLYFWRNEKLRVQEADANYQMADASLQSMHNMVRAEVESAFYKVEQAARSVRLFQHTIIPQAEQSLLASRAAYENNKVDFLMLLDSQRTLRELKLAAHQALADFGTRLAELELAVGTQLVNLD